MKDCLNNSGTISVYQPHLESINPGDIMNVTNLKKSKLKKEGQWMMRLHTTRNTKFLQIPSSQQHIFSNVFMGDSTTEGSIIGFSSINCYRSCGTHKNKLMDNECPQCEGVPTFEKQDISMDLHISVKDQEDKIETFVVFKNAVPQIDLTH